MFFLLTHDRFQVFEAPKRGLRATAARISPQMDIQSSSHVPKLWSFAIAISRSVVQRASNLPEFLHFRGMLHNSASDQPEFEVEDSKSDVAIELITAILKCTTSRGFEVVFKKDFIETLPRLCNTLCNTLLNCSSRDLGDSYTKDAAEGGVHSLLIHCGKLINSPLILHHCTFALSLNNDCRPM